MPSEAFGCTVFEFNREPEEAVGEIAMVAFPECLTVARPLQTALSADDADETDGIVGGFFHFRSRRPNRARSRFFSK